MKNLILSFTFSFPLFCIAQTGTYQSLNSSFEQLTSDNVLITDRQAIKQNIDSLAPGKAYTFSQGRGHFIYFIDHMNNKHEIYVPHDSPELVQFTIFDQRTQNVLVRWEFYYGSLRLRKNSYSASASKYEGKEYVFRDWEHYWASFAMPTVK